MNGEAFRWMEVSQDKIKKIDLSEFEKKAKAGWEKLTPGLSKFTREGVEKGVAWGKNLEDATTWMLNPKVILKYESSVNRVIDCLYDQFNYEQAVRWNENLDVLKEIPEEVDGVIAWWIFPDGSGWVYWDQHERAIVADLLVSKGWPESEGTHECVWKMWEQEEAPLALQVGRKWVEAYRKKESYIKLTPAEMKAFIRGWVSQMSESGQWKNGLSLKDLKAGVPTGPEEVSNALNKALKEGMVEQKRKAFEALEEIKKINRPAPEKVNLHWRDMLSMLLTQSQSHQVYDGGMAAFLMHKEGLFNKKPLSFWKKIIEDVIEVVKRKQEGQDLNIKEMIPLGSALGHDVAVQMGHFLVRYHRMNGAKDLAKRVVEGAKNHRDLDLDLLKEITKAAYSTEFSTQYGGALALYVALWAHETGFASIEEQCYVLLKTIRGHSESCLESVGWCTRLMYEFGEGFVEKESLINAIMDTVDVVKKEDQEKSWGKKSMENEWSGSWGKELMRKKVMEYLNAEELNKSKRFNG